MTTSFRKPYLNDLSDAQWKLIASHIVLPTGGAPKTTDVREIDLFSNPLRVAIRCFLLHR